MTLSYNRLQHYISEKISPQELEDILNSIGLEVEEVVHYSSISSNLENCYVGKVLECKKHPNADRLKITKVDVKNEILDIICGAPNVEINQKVIVAKVGAVLTNYKGETLAIKKAKIRGLESYGMICAEDELGISDNHNGIIVLNDTPNIGTPATSYFNPYQDTIFNIGLTPNRADAMSHFGAVRNIVYYLQFHKNKNISLLHPLPAYNTRKSSNNVKPIEVVIHQDSDCFSFCGVYIKNIQNTPSPKFIQNTLKSIGIKTINAVVDITNYLMVEYGKPLHAYDADTIIGNKIVVKKSPQQETFIGLNGKKITITPNDTLITDGKGNILCLGGVFGGLNSSVKDNTKNIFIESAFFNPINIRKTMTYHNLRTESASRFEKGIDPFTIKNILPEAIKLILKYCGGEVVGNIIQHPKDFETAKSTLTFSYNFITQNIGQKLEKDIIHSLLLSCGYSFENTNDETIKVSVPSHKINMEQPIHVVGDILRIIGYNNIKLKNTISISTELANNYSHQENIDEKINNVLIGRGFYEILSDPIIQNKENDVSDFKNGNSIYILNAIASPTSTLRTSWEQSSLKVVAYNINRKKKNLQFFEKAKIYYEKNGQYHENESIYFLTTGNLVDNHYRNTMQPFSEFYMKGIAITLLEKIGIKDYKEKIEDNQSITYVSPYEKLPLISLHKTANNTLDFYDINQNVFTGTIYLKNISRYTSSNKTTYKPISEYPEVDRDLSFILDNSISFHQIKEVINSLKLKELQHYTLVDMFANDILKKKKKKSYSLRFLFQSDESTFKSKDIENYISKIISALENNLHAEIRDKKI